LKIEKNVTFYVFLNGFTRFLKLCFQPRESKLGTVEIHTFTIIQLILQLV